jgi:acetate kinase
MKILVLNAGSSSQKSSLYDLTAGLPPNPPNPIWEAQIDWGRSPHHATIMVKTAAGKQTQTTETRSRSEDTRRMLQTLWDGEQAVLSSPDAIDGVGHRVVHGGQDYRQSVRITAQVKAAIERLKSLAPSHNPANLDGILAIEQVLGDRLPQVAVFDTAFHSQIPPAAATYPVPHQWTEQGIRRYGFHGISHQYCSQRAAQLLGNPLNDLRLITCHLGNGASLAAVRHGHSIDTTMGFTPLEGLMMGSRCGSIDPGIIIHRLRQQDCTVDELDAILNKQSGLLGVSAISSDLREILEAIAAGHAQAQLAFDMYIHRLRSHLGSMWMSLGGVDALVFTAGVGEHSPQIRAAACDGLEFLGVKLDGDRNQSNPVDTDIAHPDSAVRILVIHTQEDWAIAQDCWRILTAD